MQPASLRGKEGGVMRNVILVCCLPDELADDLDNLLDDNSIVPAYYSVTECES